MSVGNKCSFIGEDGYLLQTFLYEGGGWDIVRSWRDITMSKELVRAYPFLKEKSNLVDCPVGAIYEFGSLTDEYDNSDQPFRLVFFKKDGVSYIQVLKGYVGEIYVATYQSPKGKNGISEIDLTSGNKQKFRAIVNFDLIPERRYPEQLFIINSRIRYKATCLDIKALHNSWMRNVLFKNEAEVSILPLNCVTEIYTTDRDVSSENMYFSYIRAIKYSSNANYITLIQVVNESGNILCQYYNTDTAPDIVETYHLYKVSRVGKTDFDIYVNAKLLGTGEIAFSKELPIIVQYRELTKSSDSRLDKFIFQPNRLAGLNNNKFVNNGFIINIWKEFDPENSNNFVCEKVLFRNITNNNFGAIAQFEDREGNIFQSYFATKEKPRSGIETLKINCEAVKKGFYMMVDWDAIAGEAHSGIEDVVIDTAKIPYINNDEAFEKIQNELIFNGRFDPVADVGVKVPQRFTDKLYKMEKDLEIVLVGDSLTGLTRGSGYIPFDHASIMPPGFTTYHWHYWLWKYLLRNYPSNVRLDKMQKEGEWAIIVDGKFDSPNDWGEYSESAKTFQSNSNGASVSFQWDFSKFEKTNIVYSKNPDGDKSVITVLEGAGNILVSENKKDWVEANGYVLDTNSNPDKLSDEDIKKQCKILHSRHRRLWMKRQKGSGVVNVKIKKQTPDTTKYMYMWGIEQWNGCAIFITNLGRGGRTTRLLNFNIDDIADRKPDLLIYEMPLANEFGNDSLEGIKTQYKNYFLGGGDLSKSLKSVTNSYADTDVVVLCPHGRSSDFTGDNYVIDKALAKPRYIAQKEVLLQLSNEIKQAGFGEHFSFLNLYDLLISEGRNRRWSIQQTFSEGYLTIDGIHLNAAMSRLWAKYIVPMFY